MNLSQIFFKENLFIYFSFFRGRTTNQCRYSFQRPTQYPRRLQLCHWFRGKIISGNVTNNSKGLPPEWEVLLKTSGISKADVLDRPEMVLEVLNFNDQYQKQQNKGNGHITVTNDDVIGVSKPVPKGVAPPPPKQEAPVAIPESNSAPPEDKQLSLGNFAKC